MVRFIKYLQNPFQKGKKEKGITLLEILAVLVIIALVFIALSRNFGFGTDKAKMTDVQQAMKPYQIAFEGSMNEYSGFPFSVAGGANLDYTMLNRYLGADYQISTPSTGGTGTTHPTANPMQTTVFKDPWNSPYVVQGKYISQTNFIIGVRSTGKDKAMGTSGVTADIFNIPTTGTDADDILFITEFKNGLVKSCTVGFEKNVGKANITSNLVTGCQ